MSTDPTGEELDRARSVGVVESISAVKRIVVFGRDGKSSEYYAPSWMVSVQDDGHTLKVWADPSGRPTRVLL